MSHGFIKLMRSDMAEALIDPANKRQTEFWLLSLVSLRASRDGNPILGLKPGEAVIGTTEFEGAGITRRKIRTALDRLVKYGLVTIRTTNRGTVVALTNTDVFDINASKAASKTTKDRPSSDQQPATIKKDKKYFIQEVRNMGVPEDSILNFFAKNREGLKDSEKALVPQLNKLNELREMGFSAERVFKVLEENPGWKNIKTDDYFVNALTGGGDVRSELTNTNWAGGYQPDFSDPC